MKRLVLSVFFIELIVILSAQDFQFSSCDNIQIATFGNMSEESCVDDDFSQTIFMTIPESYKGNFFVRIFDPDCGGENDLSLGLWETNTSFAIYGGEGCFSEADARNSDPLGNYKSGKLLAKALFAEESALDGKWFSFGPFSVNDGEALAEYKGYRFFKLLVEGDTGNDGNMYDVMLSKSEKKNVAINKAALFHYELTFINTESDKLDRMECAIAMSEAIILPIKLEPVEVPGEHQLIAIPIKE